MSGAGRKKWIVVIVLLLLCGSTYIGTSRWMADLKVPLLDGSTVTVVPGVHLIGGIGPSAAYVVETSEGLILIDTGLEADAGPLKAEMKKLGLEWNRIRAIFLTHVHGDHTGGAEQLRAETGARIYAGRADAGYLVAGAPREAFFSTFKMPGYVTHATHVDVELLGDESIRLGEAQVRAVATPGHTGGSTCYLVERSGLRILFSGDVIMRLGEKPFGTYSAYLAPRFRGDAKSYLSSLIKLQELRVPDLLLPGHPNASRDSQSPRLNSDQWAEMLDGGIREMERLIARYDADGANFLDGSPKRLLPDLYYFGDFRGAAVYGFFKESRFFVIDAVGGPGLRDFLNTQFQELDLKLTTPFAVLLTGCSESETAGLKDLIQRDETQVIASPDGIDAVKSLCLPETIVIPATELRQKGWFPVNAIALGGTEKGRTAYQLRWANKNVLFSGRTLTVLDSLSPDDSRLAKDVSKPDGNDVVEAIRRLFGVKPDLWLPSTPTDGQNANLYEGEWNTKLEKIFRSVQ